MPRKTLPNSRRQSHVVMQHSRSPWYTQPVPTCLITPAQACETCLQASVSPLSRRAENPSAGKMRGSVLRIIWVRHWAGTLGYSRSLISAWAGLSCTRLAELPALDAKRRGCRGAPLSCRPSPGGLGSKPRKSRSHALPRWRGGGCREHASRLQFQASGRGGVELLFVPLFLV